jgi:hypothetical protein
MWIVEIEAAFDSFAKSPLLDNERDIHRVLVHSMEVRWF